MVTTMKIENIVVQHEISQIYIVLILVGSYTTIIQHIKHNCMLSFKDWLCVVYILEITAVMYQVQTALNSNDIVEHG